MDVDAAYDTNTDIGDDAILNIDNASIVNVEPSGVVTVEPGVLSIERLGHSEQFHRGLVR